MNPYYPYSHNHQGLFQACAPRGSRISDMADNSKWMEQLSRAYPMFNQLPLNKIAMPGSHDAGMNPRVIYTPGPDNFDTRNLILFDTMKPLLQPFIAPWAITQDFQVREQLMAGSRYFDLRVAPMVANDAINGYTVCEEKLYTLHGVYGQSVRSILKQIGDFLRQNTQEIVVLDFQHLYEMTGVSYQKLNNLIQEYLGQWLIPTSYNLTWPLSQFLADNKRVLVSIGDDHQRYMEPRNPFSYLPSGLYWPRDNALVSNWFDTTKKAELKEASDKEVVLQQSNNRTLWVLQEVLTPNAEVIIKAALNEIRPEVEGQFSLKALESNMLSELPNWVRGWTNQGLALNIVMFDFVNSITSQAIIENNIPRIL